MAQRVALISGVTGQDGALLAEILLGKGYVVHGVKRRSSSFNTQRIDHLYQDPHEPETRLRLLYGDLNDSSSLNTILRTVQPDEIYNLGAQSHVRVSFDVPEYTAEVAGIGVVRILEAIRDIAYIKWFAPTWQSFIIAPGESRVWGEAHEAARAELTWAPEQALLVGFTLFALAMAGLVWSCWTGRQRVWLALGGGVEVLVEDEASRSLGHGLSPPRRWAASRCRR